MDALARPRTGPAHPLADDARDLRGPRALALPAVAAAVRAGAVRRDAAARPAARIAHEDEPSQ